MTEVSNLLALARENRTYRKRMLGLEQDTLGQFSWYRSLMRALKKAYRWQSPFTVSRLARGRVHLPDSDLIYGEMLPLTAYQLLSSFGVDQADHVVELGGGSSVFSLVAVCAFGCRATVLEVIPGFVSRTREVVGQLGLERLTVRQQDFLQGELPEGTLYYLTGTTFSEASWEKLQRQMAGAPQGTRAVSLSASLDSKAWRVESESKLPYSWGENTVYVQVRK